MYRVLLSIVLLFPIIGFSETILKFSSEGMNMKLEKVASNLGVVWGMSFISKNRLVFTLKRGKIGILNLDTKKINYLKNTPKILYNGQGGLLDVQASPSFKSDKLLFFTYVKKVAGEGVTVLAQAKLLDNNLKNWKELLVTKSATDTSRHFGSRITFDEKGHIFFSVGDRGYRPNGQNLKTHAGSILRLNSDGTIPNDNPFIYKKDRLSEIYSYGHRNPQGVFFDKKTKQLWIIEHGPRGGDEINLIKKGANYGWPIISYGKEYWNPLHVGEGTHKKGMEQPVKYYVPSIAPSSLIVYRGKNFPKWNGNLLSGALKLRHLNRIVLDENNKFVKEERLLKGLGERIRNVIESPTGYLFISTDNGNIYSIKNE